MQGQKGQKEAAWPDTHPPWEREANRTQEDEEVPNFCFQGAAHQMKIT